MNQAEALYRIGFTVTEWWDIANGYPGVYHAGVFDPTKSDTLGRYGVSSLSSLRYDPNNYTGSHASGLNPFAMENLAAVLADAVHEPVTLDDNALADMDMVRGATQWVIQRALAMGLLAPAAPVTPPLPPVDSTPAGGDVAKDLQIAALTGKVNAARKIAQAAFAKLPTKGGGEWVQLGKATYPAIIQALASVLLLCFLLVSTGCAANRAVKTAVASQGAGVAGLIHCADVVTRNPAQAVVLTASLNRAQVQLDAGSPLLGLLTVADPGLDPQAKLAIQIVNDLLAQKMTDFLAAAQSAINGCRMGILSAVKP